MRYGIFSDVHGNLEAFDAVIKALAKEPVDMYLCGGDIVGYGANPGECIDRVRALGAVSVAGNHEWGVSGKLKLAAFNPLAAEAITWTRKRLDAERKDFLKNLPPEFGNEDLIMVHGTLENPQVFTYLFTLDEAAGTFAVMDKDICFVGHTHIPLVIKQRGGHMSCVDSPEVHIRPEEKYIINPGSVGQPRDKNPEAAYCIYDTQAKTVYFKRTPYDIGMAQAKIIDAGLPKRLAIRLGEGQ